MEHVLLLNYRTTKLCLPKSKLHLEAFRLEDLLERTDTPLSIGLLRIALYAILNLSAAEY